MSVSAEKKFWALILVALFFIPASWLILSGYGKGSNFADQQEFHLPTIVQFVNQWPHLDLRDYSAAHTPGYHILLAAIMRYTGASSRILQFVGAIITTGFLITLYLALARRTGPRNAFGLSLPLVGSIYIFQAGVWIMADNPATWGMLVMLLLALRKPADARTFVGGGLILAIAVMIRQIDIWAAALLWAAAWNQTANGRGAHALEPRHQLLIRRETWNWLAAAAAASTPAIMGFSYFLFLWHGLTPPRFKVHATLTPVEPAFFLSLFAIYGLFFLPFIWKETVQLLKARPASFWIVLCAASSLAILPVSTYNFELHRYGGLWNMLPVFPTIGGRSLLILVMAPLGGMMMLAWAEAYRIRKLHEERLILMVAVAAFLIAHFVTFPWQRYYEPFILILLTISAATIGSISVPGSQISPAAPERSRSWLSIVQKMGPIALFAFLAILTVMTIK